MSDVLFNETNGVLNIELHRREKHNAFTPEMIRLLAEAFLSAEKRTDLRAIYIWGHGASFCAGADLTWMKEMVKYDKVKNLDDAGILFDMFQAAKACSLPILGRLQGNVFGGGLGLVSICDVVAADPATRFSFSEVRLGIVPAVISPFVLDKMNSNKARELLITGRIFEAKEALASGLIEYVGRELEIQSFIDETLDAIFAAGPQSVRDIKRHLHQLRGLTTLQSKESSVQLIAQKRIDPEAQEGMTSFFEKRKPNWHKKISKDKTEE